MSTRLCQESSNRIKLNSTAILIEKHFRCFFLQIDQYALHILSTSSQRSRLSTAEISYLKSHQALLNNLYLSAFLRNFPDNLRRLDDTAGGISMVEEPDLDTAVFIKVNRDTNLQMDDVDGGELSLSEGDIYVIRYSAVKEAVKRGEVELI